MGLRRVSKEQCPGCWCVQLVDIDLFIEIGNPGSGSQSYFLNWEMGERERTPHESGFWHIEFDILMKCSSGNNE